MKKLLFALALTSFVSGAAFATDGDKNAKKNAKKECTAEAKAGCAKTMATGGKPGCCASKNKIASLIAPSPSAAEPIVEKAETKKTL